MTDLTKEESDKLITALDKLKIKPKADTPKDDELLLKTYWCRGGSQERDC